MVVGDGFQASAMTGGPPLPSIVRQPPGRSSARTRLAAPSSLRIVQQTCRDGQRSAQEVAEATPSARRPRANGFLPWGTMGNGPRGTT